MDTEAEVKDEAKLNLTRVVQFRVTEDVGRELDAIAAGMDVKLSWLARKAIKTWLAERKEQG